MNILKTFSESYHLIFCLSIPVDDPQVDLGMLYRNSRSAQIALGSILGIENDFRVQ